MSKFKFVFFVLGFAFALASCESSDVSEGTDNPNFTATLGDLVTRDFMGQVVDATNAPLQNVVVKIGSTSVLTDLNGVFILNNASVNQHFAYITAKKTGYVDGSRSMVPTTGKNQLRIMLLEDQPMETISSGVASEVAIYSGTKVVFDGAFMDENGTTYSGSVAVFLLHLTPSDANISELMPGMLLAQDENGGAKMLETFGMLRVELRGSSGQKLQIATGHTAQITMRIDDAQLATCPSSIPLWHFDDDKGYWKQEGSATKVGNYYVGSVSHFSWWNCDTFLSTVYLNVTIVDMNGNPLPNLKVSLSVNSTSMGSNYMTTDTAGQVGGLVPANESFTLNVHQETCGVIYSSSIGPFATNTTLPTIMVSNNLTTQSTLVTGSLRKCDATPVTNGYVLFNNTTLFPVVDGNFSFNALYCISYPHFRMKGVDVADFQESEEINYSYTTPKTNLGTLLTCNSISEFVIYQLDNLPLKTLISNVQCTTYSAIGNYYKITAATNGTTNIAFTLESHNRIPGVYTTSICKVSSPDIAINLSTPNTLSFNLSAFGAVGQPVDVTFNGTYSDTLNASHTISGIAHVIRDF